MSLHGVPASQRVHIAFFGRTNAGKSSVVNQVTGQSLSLVSEISGTTTDPVMKTMELLPLGPVVIIDTAGMDDNTPLGQMREKKTIQILHKTDIALLIVDATVGMMDRDKSLIEELKRYDIPYILVYNKMDLLKEVPKALDNEIYVSALTGDNIFELKEKIAALMHNPQNEKLIMKDILSPGDLVLLVVPVDDAAPKGRLILPQQMVLREILDCHALAVVVQDTEVKDALSRFTEVPKMVITDSQAFEQVAKDVPDDIYLTSFSILMARYKGNLSQAVNAARSIDHLKDGDKVLISEGCTHHRQCGDIGTVKLPYWLNKYTGKKLNYEFTSGREFPEDLSGYALVIHCGGCMLNEKEMQYRYGHAQNMQVPITNYGICIAHLKGILERSLELFSI